MESSSAKGEKTSIVTDEEKVNLERLKLYLGFAKFVSSLLFGTVLTTLITGMINYRELRIKEKESQLELQLNERAELANYFRYTMEGNVYDRLKLSVFFGSVLTNEEARELWMKYHEDQEKLLHEFLASTIELNKLEDELTSPSVEVEVERKVTIEQKNADLVQLLSPVSVEFSTDNVIKNSDSTSLTRQIQSANTPQPGYKFDTSKLNNPIIEGSNFTWSEATKGGERLPPSQIIEDNIIKLAIALDKMQKTLFPNNKILVNSWYRYPETNRSVGGPSRSWHQLGLAVKFSVVGIDMSEAFSKVDKYWKGGVGNGVSRGSLHVDLRVVNARWSY